MPHGDSHGASLCAEWARLPTTRTAAASVHLCACGVDVTDESGRDPRTGSSLRVRSGLEVVGDQKPDDRCISACAEWALADLRLCGDFAVT